MRRPFGEPDPMKWARVAYYARRAWRVGVEARISCTGGGSEFLARCRRVGR